ncbi:hypothetical protein L7F22_044364 [Adiantum nelumboides]|nr:hypothetical protein [Adiantum nelumboides]
MANADHLLYVQKTDAGIVIFTVYVDDLSIGGDALEDVEHVKALLRKQFDMNFGELQYFLGIEGIMKAVYGFLGIETICYESGIWLSQERYGLVMLTKYGMANCKPTSTPLDHKLLRIDEGEVLEDSTMYRKIVGNSIYITISWPDDA